MYEKYRLPFMAVLVISMIIGLTIATIVFEKLLVIGLAALFIIQSIKHLFDYDRYKSIVSTMSKISVDLKSSSEEHRVKKETVEKDFELNGVYLTAAELELWHWIVFASERADLDDVIAGAIELNTPFFSPEIVSHSLTARHVLSRNEFMTAEVTNTIDLQTSETGDEGGDDD